jgi:hypothetical protein
MQLLTRDEADKAQEKREAEAADRPVREAEGPAARAARLQAEANARAEASPAHAERLADQARFLEATGERLREVQGCRFHWSPYATDSVSLMIGLSLSRDDEGVAVNCDIPELAAVLSERFPMVVFEPVKSASKIGWPKVTVPILQAAMAERWCRALAQFPEDQQPRIVVCTGLAELIEHLRPVVQRLTAAREKQEAADAEAARAEARNTRGTGRPGAEFAMSARDLLERWRRGERLTLPALNRLIDEGKLRRDAQTGALTEGG